MISFSKQFNTIYFSLNLHNMVDFSEGYNEVHLLSFPFITEEFST